MPTRESKQHIHTYYFLKQRDKMAYCADPYCTHSMQRVLLKGKASLCNLCGSEFILTQDDLVRAKPRCTNCSRTKEALTYQKAQALAQALVQQTGQGEEKKEEKKDWEDYF